MYWFAYISNHNAPGLPIGAQSRLIQSNGYVAIVSLWSLP